MKLINLSARSIQRLGAGGLMGLSLLLQGCAPMLLGTAVGTVLVSVDRRSAGTQLNDETIELKGAAKVREFFDDSAHISVTSFNTLVLLTGQVSNMSDKNKIESAISELENVKMVVNDLELGFPSSLSVRAADAVITAKMRALLIDAKDLTSSSFKIVTERGKIYLMGRVTEQEAKKATQIAQSINGVNKVVQVFDLLTEAELEKLLKRNDGTR